MDAPILVWFDIEVIQGVAVWSYRDQSNNLVSQTYEEGNYVQEVHEWEEGIKQFLFDRSSGTCEFYVDNVYIGDNSGKVTLLDPNVGLGWFLFDDADELTAVGVDIAAGMNNKDLKAKHGIMAKDANN